MHNYGNENLCNVLKIKDVCVHLVYVYSKINIPENLVNYYNSHNNTSQGLSLQPVDTNDIGDIVKNIHSNAKWTDWISKLVHL